MAFHVGEEVSVKTPQHLDGIIARLTDSNPGSGNVYLVEVGAFTLRLRESDLEVIDVPQAAKDESALSERARALADAQRLFDEWGGNFDTDPLPEPIRDSLRKAFNLK